MTRLGTLLVVVVLIAAACGGGGTGTATDDTTAATGDTTTTITDNGDSTSGDVTTTTAAADISDLLGVGEASVTIDGETYHFGEGSLGAFQCKPDYFGVFIVALALVDESGAAIPSGGSLQLTLLQDGTDPDVVGQLPAAEVDISASDQDWVADETSVDSFDQLTPGSSQVDDYSIDGNTATGSATFFEQNSYWAFIGGVSDTIQVTEGQFEVTCAES